MGQGGQGRAGDFVLLPNIPSLWGQSLVREEGSELAKQQLCNRQEAVDLVLHAERTEPLDSSLVGPLCGFCNALLRVVANRMVQCGESQSLLGSISKSINC